MKNNYLIQVIDLRFQIDQITPKKIQLFEDLINDPDNLNARLFVILIRHRKNERISDGNKYIEVKVSKIINIVCSLLFKSLLLL